MLAVQTDDIDGLKRIRLINTSSGELVSIVPEFGGNICELVLGKGKKNYSVLDGYSSCSEFVDHPHFQSVKLIPFPNRIKDGKYCFDGVEYQLPINRKQENHALHGFFYDRKMLVEGSSTSEDQVDVILTYEYDGDVPGYPFRFRVKIVYSLHAKNGFGCATEITNLDNRSIPVADGWHPYFKLAASINGLMLRIPARVKVEVDERKIPTGAKTPFDNFTSLRVIGETRFDTCFQLEENSGMASTEIYWPARDIKICVWQETGHRKYNYLQVYIPASRDSIAVEPMTCNVNGFNNGEGVIVLGAGEAFTASYGVRLE